MSLMEIDKFNIHTLLRKSKEISTWILVDSKFKEREDDTIELRRLLTIPNTDNWKRINDILRPVEVNNWRRNINNNSSINTSIGG